jgi:CheY-like chemotaxis protein
LTAAPRTVLVVDDRRDVAEIMAELCRDLGYDAVVGEDGAGMHDLLARHRPDCVIVDVMMPGEDGYEALKQIASFDAAMPVLLVTGHGDDWLRIGETLGRAQGLAALRTAAKPLRATTIAAFLGVVGAR